MTKVLFSVPLLFQGYELGQYRSCLLIPFESYGNHFMIFLGRGVSGMSNPNPTLTHTYPYPQGRERPASRGQRAGNIGKLHRPKSMSFANGNNALRHTPRKPICSLTHQETPHLMGEEITVQVGSCKCMVDIRELNGVCPRCM